MNAKHLKRIIELEERLNTICKTLVLGESDHFKIEFCQYEISIIAFSHSEARAAKIKDLMRIFAEPDDALETREISRDTGKFWTIDLRIGL